MMHFSNISFKKVALLASLTFVSLFIVAGVTSPSVTHAGGSPLPQNAYANQNATPIPPVPVTASCNGNDTVDIVWSAPAGFTPDHYWLRVNDATAGVWKSDSCDNENPGDICLNNVTSTTYTFQGIAGHHYVAWAHSVNFAGTGSAAATIGDFTCPVASQPSQPIQPGQPGFVGPIQQQPTAPAQPTQPTQPTNPSSYYYNNVSDSNNTTNTTYTNGGYDGGYTYTNGYSYPINSYNNNQYLDGSCTASEVSGTVGNQVTFTAQPIGGNGYYTYSWSGTDNLWSSSQSASQYYTYAGLKTATVSIYSNGQSISRTCTIEVNAPYYNYNNTYNYGYTNPTPIVTTSYYNPVVTPVTYSYPVSNTSYNPSGLSASCGTNQTSVYVGDPVTWYVNNIYGGGGYYTYVWTGSDGLNNNNQTFSTSYTTPGLKTANVVVYSNGQSTLRTCSINVLPAYGTGFGYVTTAGSYYNTNGNGLSGVSLTQVPYTGLSSNTDIILFVLILAFWSAVVTYIFIIRPHKQAQALALVSGTVDSQQKVRQDILRSENSVVTNLEQYARSKNIIISIDALETIAQTSQQNLSRAQTMLTNIAKKYQIGNEYVTLNVEKVQQASN